MSRKYAYADFRHILSVLSKDVSVAFAEEYGCYDNDEKIFDDVYMPLSGLIEAFQAEVFPQWASKYMDMLHNGELYQRIKIFQDIYQ